MFFSLAGRRREQLALPAAVIVLQFAHSYDVGLTQPCRHVSQDDFVARRGSSSGVCYFRGEILISDALQSQAFNQNLYSEVWL